MNRVELLAPAGDMERFYTAIHFGADAVYLSGKSFGLRAYCDNFSIEEISLCCAYAHERNVKVYVTVNIFALDEDFIKLEQYIKQLSEANVDAVIVSDIGVMKLVKEAAPNLAIHVSTQTSITNSKAIRVLRDELGAERVVLARELSLDQIAEINKNLNGKVETEVFVHGAMCVSYSGRCLLSNYFTDRKSNRGECVQACRWKWKLSECDNPERGMEVEEDVNGTYFLSSKDLCMLPHVSKVLDSGVKSLKIEGRMKTAYYVAVVVNAYRRAIDAHYGNNFSALAELTEEVLNASNRGFTTGFYFDKNDTINYLSSKAVGKSEFVAAVRGWDDGWLLVEQRNRFGTLDELEILSNDENFGKTIVINEMRDNCTNEVITDAKNVQQLIKIKCDIKLSSYDILRRR